MTVASAGNGRSLAGGLISLIGLAMATTVVVVLDWLRTTGSSFRAIREWMLDPGSPPLATIYFTWGLPAVLVASALLMLCRQLSPRLAHVPNVVSALVGVLGMAASLGAIDLSAPSWWSSPAAIWRAAGEGRGGFWVVLAGFALLTAGSAMGGRRIADQARPPGGWAVAAVLTVIVAVIGVVSGWQLYQGLRAPTQPADPRLVALPELSADRSEVAGYLKGDGAILVRFVTASERIDSDTVGPGCRLVGDVLDRIGTPAAIIEAATRVPDPNLQAASVNQVLSVTAFMTACGTGVDHADALRQVQFTRVVLLRMFDEVGVR